MEENMKKIDDTFSLLLVVDDPLKDGFATMKVIGVAYEPIAYLCKVLECVGSKEFKKDDEIAILPYTGEILVNGNREKKDGLFVSDFLGMQTGQYQILERGIS